MEAFCLGDPVRVSTPLAIPLTSNVIWPGETGRIVDVDPDAPHNGVIRFDQPIPGLEATRNLIPIQPWQCERARPRRSNSLRVALSCATIAAVGLLYFGDAVGPRRAGNMAQADVMTRLHACAALPPNNNIMPTADIGGP